MVGRIIELTAVLIALFLILTNASSFGQATSAIGNLYIGAVRQLQGNPGQG